MYESTIELVSFMITIKFVHEKFNIWTGSKPEFSLLPMNDNGLDTEEILKSTLFLYIYFNLLVYASFASFSSCN